MVVLSVVRMYGARALGDQTRTSITQLSCPCCKTLGTEFRAIYSSSTISALTRLKLFECLSLKHQVQAYHLLDLDAARLKVSKNSAQNDLKQ